MRISVNIVRDKPLQRRRATIAETFWMLLQFVAHPNCQQHLTSIWFGPQMGFLQSLNLWKKLLLWIVCIPLMPFFCIVYIIAPDCKVESTNPFESTRYN